MTVAELVFGNVLDQKVHEAQGDRGPAGINLPGVPGPALPFTVYRAWKLDAGDAGTVTEEVRFVGPSGRTVFTLGPVARTMTGTTDVTEERDVVTDAVFDEAGTYSVSFVIDEQVVGQIEVPVLVQQAPAKLPKEIEDGLKRSDVIWVGVEDKGARRTAPVWFSFKNGRIFVLSKKERGPEEQTVPGIPDAPEVLVVARRKGRDTSLGEFRATTRVLVGAEWEEAAKVLADRRRSRVGSPADRIVQWRGSCEIAELIPIV